MSSVGGSSRLLVVCCCVSFISVFLYCVGFVRLELELQAYRERLVTLEQKETGLERTHTQYNATNGEYTIVKVFRAQVFLGSCDEDAGKILRFSQSNKLRI